MEDDTVSNLASPQANNDKSKQFASLASNGKLALNMDTGVKETQLEKALRNIGKTFEGSERDINIISVLSIRTDKEPIINVSVMEKTKYYLTAVVSHITEGLNSTCIIGLIYSKDISKISKNSIEKALVSEIQMSMLDGM